jgi:ribosomal-protein-alanine N-acetyltransferase
LSGRLSNAASIRTANAGDVQAVHALAASQPNAPHWPPVVYEEMLVDEKRCLFVAEIGDMLAGFLAVVLTIGEAEIESIAIEPRTQRQGIGRQLGEAAIGWARDHHAHIMRLEVRAANASAQSLYRALGFEVCGLRPSYYQAPVDDAIAMRLLLNEAVAAYG